MEEQRPHHHLRPHAPPERKGQKRKLEVVKHGDEEDDDRDDDDDALPPPLAAIRAAPSPEPHHALISQIRSQVDLLHSAFSWADSDRSAAKCATHVLAELAKNEEIVNVIVECGAVLALVKHLRAPPVESERDEEARPFEHEVEKGSAFALGLLAVKCVWL